MKNEYRMSPGETKVLDQEVLPAVGSEPCVYQVRLLAECLSDGSVVGDVKVDLKQGGLRLRTWTWHPVTIMTAANLFHRLCSRLATGSLVQSLEDGRDIPDTVDDNGSMDVSLVLGLLRDAYRTGRASGAKTQDPPKPVKVTLENIDQVVEETKHRLWAKSEAL